MIKTAKNSLMWWGVGMALVILSGCQSEMAKWEFASAQIQAEAGETASAIPRLRNAVEQSGHDSYLKLEFAKILAKERDRESIRLCDEVLQEITDGSYRGFSRPKVMFVKSMCQQDVGDFAGGLATYKRILADHVSRNALELNNLAYNRALAQEQLSLAAENIELAIDDVESRARWTPDSFLTLPVKAAISIGLISRYLNKPERGLDCLSEVILSIEADSRRFQSLVHVAQNVRSQTLVPLDEETANTTKIIAANERLFRLNLATMLVTRALLHQDLGDHEACNQDRFRVQELGFDSNELVGQLPSEQQCLMALEQATTFLDTRGFIMGLLPWQTVEFERMNAGGEEASSMKLNELRVVLDDEEDPFEDPPSQQSTAQRLRSSSYAQALFDMDLAVAAVETWRLTMASPLYNSPDNPVNQMKKRQQDLRYTHAVLLYHRMLIHRRQGNDEATELDEQKILELGFVPDERLH